MIDNTSLTTLTQELNSGNISEDIYSAIVRDKVYAFTNACKERDHQKAISVLAWGNPYTIAYNLSNPYFEQLVNHVFQSTKPYTPEILHFLKTLPTCSPKSFNDKLIANLHNRMDDKTLNYYIKEYKEEFLTYVYPKINLKYENMQGSALLDIVIEKNPEKIIHIWENLSEYYDSDTAHNAHELYKNPKLSKVLNKQPQETIQKLMNNSVKYGNLSMLEITLSLGAELPVDKQTISNLIGKNKMKVVNYYLTHFKADMFEHLILKQAIYNCKTKTDEDLGEYKPILDNILSYYTKDNLLSIDEMLDKRDDSLALQYVKKSVLRLKLNNDLKGKNSTSVVKL